MVILFVVILYKLASSQNHVTPRYQEEYSVHTTYYESRVTNSQTITIAFTLSFEWQLASRQLRFVCQYIDHDALYHPY